MLTLRHRLATSLGLSDDVLPFVGELIKVPVEHAAWRGAIERLLHGFALSILVQERHYVSLATLVNEQHLGNRLVYYRTDRPSSAGGKSASLNSVVRKLQIQTGNNHDWLAAELRNRFDYACVDSLKAFRETERGLTREGQIRHGRHHHAKDDRRRIDDPTSWVLGFDNRDKLSLFEAQAHELAEKLTSLDRDIRAIEQDDEARSERVLHCNTVVNLRWDEIDVAPMVERLSAIQREIDAIHAGNDSLKVIAKEIDEERKRLAAAEKSLRQIEAHLLRTQERQKDASELHRKTTRALAGTPLLPSHAEALPPRFASLPQSTTLDNLADQSRNVERALTSERQQLIDERNGLEKRIERAFAEFKSSWAAEASDLDATLASASDFFAKLKRLEIDGLPQYEHRFFDLLKEQSNQNLASLNSQLRQARNEIVERMDSRQ